MNSKNLKVKECLFDLLIHDLTGPLSVASIGANGLLNKTSRYGAITDQQKEVLERILRNVHRAQALLHEMLEIFRSEEGIFQKELFSVEKVLRESILDVMEVALPHVGERIRQTEHLRKFCELLETQGISIKITGLYCRSPFCHDPQKIQQIFRNLFSNALKYRRQHMAMSISGDDALLILVEDDGPGIPLEEQDAIFERFVRLEESKRPYVSGLGLGLTGVKALVEAMNGEIALESSEDAGTHFTVKIPPLH